MTSLLLAALVLIGTDPPTLLLAAASGDRGVERTGLPAAVLLPADSLDQRDRARQAQARFERLRVRSSPFTDRWGSGTCDEIVGRMCLRFRADRSEPDPWGSERAIPREGPEVGEARRELVTVLTQVAQTIPGDGWVAGQRVRYLGESDDWEGAIEAARACRSDRPGWCAALEGYALYGGGRIPEAADRFTDALVGMDAEEREDWTDAEWIVGPEVHRALRSARGPERERLVARIWWRSDPWFSTPANELQVEHFSRHTLARIRAEASTPYGFSWGNDLSQVLVRFGPEAGFERIRNRSMQLGPEDVVGRHQPDARHFVPTGPALLDDPERTLAGVDWTDFSTEQRVARSIHRPGPIPRIRDLPAQIARFRRGDSVLVAAAWAYPLPPSDHPYWEGVRADTLPPPAPTGPERGIYLRPWDPPESDSAGRDSAPLRLLEEGVHPGASGGEGEQGGYLLALGPAGRHLLSLEVRDAVHARGWRHRRPLEAEGAEAGRILLSDLLLLEVDEVDPEGPLTEEPLSALTRRAFPRLEVPPGPVEVVWEVYGLPPSLEMVPFTLEIVPRGGGFLRRAGEALRILSPPSSLAIRWTEGRTEEESPGAPLLRRSVFDLSGLATGSHELRLELRLPDQTPVVTSVEIRIVEDAPTLASTRGSVP